MAKKRKSSRTRRTNNSMYVKAYGEMDYQRDEIDFAEVEKSGNIEKIDWGSFARLVVSDLCLNSQIIETGCLYDIKLEDIHHAMRNPNRHWKLLLAASEHLMKISPHYYRLNNLYSNMAMFCWWIDIYGVKSSANKDAIKDQYIKLADKLESMELKHEFAKIMRVLPYQDIYCGLLIETPVESFFQKIDFRICELYQVQDGMYNFKMNLSAIKTTELNAYPDYVQDAYFDYVDGKSKTVWYVPPADKQICIKMNSQWTSPYPMLIGLIKDILDLDTYKKLKLQSARTDTFFRRAAGC